MSKFEFILFFLIINISGVVAQATPDLFLPKHQDGVVKLIIPDVLDNREHVFGYNRLAVFVKNEANEYTSNNAIKGKHTKENDFLIFKPYYPFENGMTYVIRTKSTNSDPYSYKSFQTGKKKSVAKAKVISIYPSDNRLPENLLRFYIYFNTPMKKGEALKHIQLIDAEGKSDIHAFMEFKQELWSGDGKRLTVLFDPGRIKRGVSTNNSRGPALQQYKQYSLSISGAWQDVYGQQLSKTTNKKIEVVKAYRTKIKINEWLVKKPKANSKEDLTIHFNSIMDFALIQSMIHLKDKEKNEVLGYWEILNHEQQIKFTPEKKWRKGKYQITVDARLEDVAGNNLQNLLDHNKEDKDNTDTYQFIDFKI